MRPAVTEFFTGTTVLASWHGPVPRLRTGDEFGSYAEMRPNEEFSYPGVLLNAASISAPKIDVTVQVACDGGLEYLGAYLIENDGTPSGSATFLTFDGNAYIEPDPVPNEWITHTFHLTAGVDYDKAAVEACIAAGAFAAVVDGQNPPPTSPTSLFVSQIDVQIGAETFLRVRQRNDGLGLSAPRVRGHSSQQRSPRVRGYR